MVTNLSLIHIWVITYFNPLYDNYEGYDHAVKVEHNYNVLTKQVEDLTAENESEFGNDPVWVNKDMMWIGGGYLNVIFRQNLPVKEKHLVLSLIHISRIIHQNDHIGRPRHDVLLEMCIRDRCKRRIKGILNLFDTPFLNSSVTH